MSDFQSQINKLVDDFVSQITTVARQAAMETLTAALGAAGGAASRRRGATSALPVMAAPSGGRANLARRVKGAKRPQNEIEKTKDRVHEFIRSNPGLRIEQINKELGTSTRDLSLPLKKLISDGQIRSEGEKRSTQYFPGDGKSRGGGGESGPKRRKKK